MDLCIHLSKRNVELGGGPFAALVFAHGQLIAAGVNLVLQSGYSIAHAEIVALLRAQQQLHSLGRPTGTPLTLYTSTDPCCQCFGALIWAGVERLVCAATTEDAESIGFDEGPKPDDWPQVLEARGIRVARQVRREEAAAVLHTYQSAGGTIYGLGSMPKPVL